MRFSVLKVTFFGLALALAAPFAATSALSQSRGAEPSAKQAPAAPQRDRSQDIEFLFGALKAAADAVSAKLVESRIMALWIASGSDTADLLMSRVKTAMDAQDLDLAIKLLDAILELRPSYAEAWNRRATVFPEKRLRTIADRHSPGFGARAAPLRRDRRPRHDHAGIRRGKARARSIPARARSSSPSAENTRAREGPHQEGRRARYLSALSLSV